LSEAEGAGEGEKNLRERCGDFGRQHGEAGRLYENEAKGRREVRKPSRKRNVSCAPRSPELYHDRRRTASMNADEEGHRYSR
jgi:hypothetical protein